MAITTLIPTFELPRSSRPFLTLISVKQASARINSRRFMFTIGLVVTLNILVVAIINILMTQDAFTLQHLKHQRNITLDQRDAILKLVDVKNSPDQLAASASKIGMVPAPAIIYLNMDANK
jgi:uncharacterized protein (UPF0218 family)